MMIDSSLSEDSSQWILTKAEYISLPYLKGLSKEEDRLRRYKATGLIQSLGIKLELPQTTIATAQVFLHRFYLREAWEAFPPDELVPALVFLAAKVEEHPRKLRDVVRLTSDSTTSASTLSTKVQWEERICQLERHILRVLCFDLTIHHPYRIALGMIKEIPDAPDELVQEAWIIINDSYRTDLCLCYPPRWIALAAVLLAARRKHTLLPVHLDPDDEQSKETLILGCPRAALHAIIQVINDLYSTSSTRS